MTQRLLVILLNTDPEKPEELAAPFYHAAVAAAMDYEVDILFTAAAGRLLIAGVAEAIRIRPDAPMTVLGWMREAHGQGARLWACPANLELHGVAESDLIPECSGMLGAATMMRDIMEGACRVMTY